MTRRHLMSLPVAAQVARAGDGISQEQARLWREFEAVWNPFAAGMNSGAFDAKRWAAVKRAFKQLGGCDKCQ